ncbi:MAG: hypothetical protein ACOCTT_00115, partial [archaeon]
MGLREIYYRVEDKWFETIDSLDKRGIPSYKAIDPLERRGIPSLPVYIAILIILLYFAVPGLIGVIQPEGPVEPEDPDEIQVPIEVIDTDSMQMLEGAEIKAMLEEEIREEQITNEEGLANLMLFSGETYNITASKEGCTNDSTTIRSQTDRENPEILKIDCEYLLAEDEVEICFDESVGKVEYIPVQSPGIVRTDLKEECGTGEEGCRFRPEKDLEYKFKSLNSEYESERRYTSEELEEKSPSEECIPMKKISEDENESDDDDNDEIDKKKGKIIYIVESEEDEHR